MMMLRIKLPLRGRTHGLCTRLSACSSAGDDGLAHLARADGAAAVLLDVGGAQALIQHLGDRPSILSAASPRKKE